MIKLFIQLAIYYPLLFYLLPQVFSQSVNIPDPALRAAIERALNKDAGEIITQSDMRLDTFTFLTANNQGITDLSGLEYATQLEILFLQENSIADITPLSNLTRLTNLYLSHNNITDISPISDISHIHTLLLDNNELSDLNNLPDLTSAKILQFHQNQITDLEPLMNHTEFRGDGRTLNLEGNPLEDNSVDNHIPSLLFYQHIEVIFTSRILKKVSGNDQTARIDTKLQPFVVEVIDHNNLTRAGEKVEFSLISGDGYFDGVANQGKPSRYSTTTDENGRASVVFNTGNTTGTHHIAVQLHKRNEYSLILIGTTPFVIQVIDRAKTSSKQILDFQPTKQEESQNPSIEESLIQQTSDGHEDDSGIPSELSKLSYHGQISISELMYVSNVQQQTLPQWIELFNSSKTETVNLRGWELYFETIDKSGKHQNIVISFEDLTMFPQRTVLLVTREGRSSKDIEVDRVYKLYENHTDSFDTDEYGFRVFGNNGFYLKISDPDGNISDVVGNMDGNSSTEDEPQWSLPSGMSLNNARTSLIRRYARDTGLPLSGTESENWRRSCELKLSVMRFWGKATDIGNPGYRGKGPLPVTISYFNAKQTEVGVEIKWITESEVENAGFNILRSQSKHGSYVKVNAKLIPGSGTTGERSSYIWIDTTALPNVSYFYQIEDVTYSGKRNTLNTIRLKGLISPINRQIIQWGSLKVN